MEKTTSVVFERRAIGYRGGELELCVRAEGRWVPRTRKGWSARKVYGIDVATTAAYMLVAISVPFVAMFSTLRLGTTMSLLLSFWAFSGVVWMSNWTRVRLDKRRKSMTLPPRWREEQERRLVLSPEQLPAEVRVVDLGEACAVEMRVGEGRSRLATDLTQAEALSIADSLRGYDECHVRTAA